MRYKFLRWLNYRIFKTKESEIAPKFVQFIYRVLFPLNSFYQKQSGIRYDPLTDVYFIRGMRFASQVFDTLRDMSKVGHKFELVETDGEVCTIETEAEANARLIASAPELLKACQSLVDDFETDYILNGVIVDNPPNLLVVNYEIAKKAIKLALGS